MSGLSCYPSCLVGDRKEGVGLSGREFSAARKGVGPDAGEADVRIHRNSLPVGDDSHDHDVENRHADTDLGVGALLGVGVLCSGACGPDLANDRCTCAGWGEPQC